MEAVADAAIDLSVALQDSAGLPIAKEKTAVLPNSAPAANSLRRCLRDLGGPPCGDVSSLSFDSWAARPVRNNYKVYRNRLQ